MNAARVFGEHTQFVFWGAHAARVFRPAARRTIFARRSCRPVAVEEEQAVRGAKDPTFRRAAETSTRAARSPRSIDWE